VSSDHLVSVYDEASHLFLRSLCQVSAYDEAFLSEVAIEDINMLQASPGRTRLPGRLHHETVNTAVKRATATKDLSLTA
jgi:hypothetical protein